MSNIFTTERMINYSQSTDCFVVRTKNAVVVWNGDVNGATNIYKIAYNAVNNKERPKYLRRSDASSRSNKRKSTNNNNNHNNNLSVKKSKKHVR